MEIKSFRASSMQQALLLVRQELGPGAAVLHTREVRRRGLSGWLGGRELELAASDGSNVPSRLQSDLGVALGPTESTPPVVLAAKASTVKSRELSQIPINRETSKLLEGPSDTGMDLLALVGDCDLWDPFKFVSTEDRAWIEQLRKREVSDEMIRQLFEQMQANPRLGGTDGWREGDVRKAIAEHLQVGRNLEVPESTARIIAAIGPTGVGKTTTIAKLAARAKFDQGKQVGLVTIDTYRIAAIDQLRTYADIMQLPMRVVASAGEVRAAIDSLADCDQIFIDTAGHSPRDEVQVQQLRPILSAAGPDETYLVVSATSGSKVLKEVLDRFRQFLPTALILTKLDEVETIGNALDFMATASMPVSYVTNGQDVPNAIDLAHVEDLARLVI